MSDAVGAPEQDVNRGGISHLRLQLLEPGGSLGKLLGFQGGDTDEIASLEIILEFHSFLELDDGSVRVASKQADAAQHVGSRLVFGMLREDGLAEVRGVGGVP